MTHHDDRFLSAPAHLLVDPAVKPVETVQLIVKGQGTISIRLNAQEPFDVTFHASDLPGAPAFRWEVGHDAAQLLARVGAEWQRLQGFSGRDVGLDPDSSCQYWFSIDSHNRRLRYGKGEMRLGTQLAEWDMPPAPEKGPDEYAWVSGVDGVVVSPPIGRPADLWRDPVTVDLPMVILPTDLITMDDMATGKATVVENLTPECQTLYANVAGREFVLDGPDFPEFSQAIEASIADEKGWCHTTLEHKATEFGKYDLEKTYLRITMGENQGESPGIPFVMEIWPPGHYSPIHNHGGADAVIRVLHGEIGVSLFRMLSPHHEKPFAEVSFSKDDVTWITPRLNQTHQLKNHSRDTTCVTIQCYAYAESDVTHYPYFDYLDGTGIAQFPPNSDMGYLEFKEQMRHEWGKRGGSA
jgi:hypothetical protein